MEIRFRQTEKKNTEEIIQGKRKKDKG